MRHYTANSLATASISHWCSCWASPCSPVESSSSSSLPFSWWVFMSMCLLKTVRNFGCIALLGYQMKIFECLNLYSIKNVFIFPWATIKALRSFVINRKRYVRCVFFTVQKTYLTVTQNLCIRLWGCIITELISSHCWGSGAIGHGSVVLVNLHTWIMVTFFRLLIVAFKFSTFDNFCGQIQEPHLTLCCSKFNGASFIIKLVLNSWCQIRTV